MAGSIEERLAYWAAEWENNQNLREAAEVLGLSRDVYLLRLLRQDFERDPVVRVASGTAKLPIITEPWA